MSRFSRLVLATALGALATPAAAHAQRAPADSLRARVVALEERVAELERRLAAFEATAALASETRTLPTGSPLAPWRKLRRGMKMSAVREVLGEPARVTAFGSSTAWVYHSGGSLVFDRDDGLESWNEP